MTSASRRLVLSCALLAPGAASVHGAEVALHAVQPAEVAAVDARVEAMLADGRLVRAWVREDALLEGRRHERLIQHHRGVPLWGAEIVRQRGPRGTLSVFGRLHEAVPEVDVVPRLSAERALQIAGDRAGAPAGEPPTLLILAGRGASGFTLAWRVRVHEAVHVWTSFLDAHTGTEILRYDDFQTQTATVGLGTGVFGDRKKMSVTRRDDAYYAADGLRPPLILTYDAGGDPVRAARLSSRFFPAGMADAGKDADNEWTDGPTVDAHTYTGWTYDYLFKVHNRRGLDGADIAIRSVVNPARREDYERSRGTSLVRFFTNAGWNGHAVLYGVGAPVPVRGQMWNHLAASLDVVAHELTHGVTQYSSDLVYFGEPGALNEAFSDIVSISVQFFHGAPSANYVVGDDIVTPGGIRSMAAPAGYGHPDHYSIRYEGEEDNGGVHINSGIANHAFYLAVEGGTNRVSGRRVEGLGAAQRVKIERAFFRAFTRMLTPLATFADARAATIQSARDLYGDADPAVRAIAQAWDAVGVS